MDLIDFVKQLGDKVVKLKDTIQTEEATKNAFIMPFIQTMGYDVFDPHEVVPEFVADIGVKKGEKVDYAIMKEGSPVILIECKHWKEDLLKHNEQLYRYFTSTKAKFGILTNGIQYMFFTDLDEPNIMDQSPFFQFNITDINENEVIELKKFHKSQFDVDSISTAASDLKYTNLIKNTLKKELNSPSQDFVRFIVSQVYHGRVTEKILQYFTDLSKKSVQQVIGEFITERLKNALAQNSEKPKEEDPIETDTTEAESKIVTTEEELDGFLIIRSILRKKIPVNRIYPRDQQSYFGILLDDNNRKPICRLYFNSSKKYIALFDEAKKETKHELSSLDDLYNYADQLEKTVDMYLTEK